ncbi:MAG: dinitrogenase iron-molybdenum cofactor biosynthesis protein [Kiritimatiellae bacterium]|nr:dinitrogenase iron-molybdenum cofactor biosynthesis protein [Kiritimatiellia bacterium]
MTRTAIPVWRGSVSTVFDFARELLVVEHGGRGEVSRVSVALPVEPPMSKARRLSELGVGVLICGAISRPLAVLVASRGIRIIPFVRGPVDRVLGAYLSGGVMNGDFRLPGISPGARRRWRGGWGRRGHGG